MAMTNPNKRDKNAQRLNGSESMSKHGTAKTRARARNRRRAAERTASNAATGQAQPPQGQAIPTSCSGSPTGVSSDATGQGEPARGEAIPTRALDDGLSEAVREELARREQSQPLQGQAIPHSRDHESD